MRWLFVVVIAACNSGSATPKPKPRTQARMLVDAAVPVASAPPQEHYAKLCAPCHGKEGKGYGADNSPSLVNPVFLESATDDFLRRSIIQGRPGTSMGAYGKALGGPLDDASVDAMVKWLRDQGPPAKPLAAVGKGDALSGEKLYTQYCKSCHGTAGERGTAPHLANAAWQQAATDPFIRHAIANGRPETRMPAFGSAMTPQQLDDVTSYVRVLGGRAPTIGALPAPTGKEPLVLNPTGKDPVWKPKDNRFISVDEVAKAMKEKKRIIIIDARPPSEWMRVHIAGAVSIPYHDLKRLDEVPKDVYAIAYCACPHHLSGEVVDELVKRGYKKALVLDEGINVWHQRGYPVVAAEGVKPPPAMPTTGQPGAH